MISAFAQKMVGEVFKKLLNRAESKADYKWCESTEKVIMINSLTPAAF